VLPRIRRAASGVSRTPLTSAEHLTHARIEAARRLERENAFHDEDQLPPGQRARLSDYAGSGFDRGHAAPSGDMSAPEAQQESFSLANMVPQDPGSNRCLWEGIESAVRALTVRAGEVWVVTGPIFEGENLRSLDGRVLVPTSLFKAIDLPSRGQAGAYVAPNAPGMDWRTVSLRDLRDLVGIEVMPTLPERAQRKAMRLPEPTPHNIMGSCCRGPVVASSRRLDRHDGRARVRHPSTATASRSEGGMGRYASLILAGAIAIALGWGLYRALGRR
jgi:endonuclease G, mitochondrial